MASSVIGSQVECARKPGIDGHGVVTCWDLAHDQFLAALWGDILHSVDIEHFGEAPSDQRRYASGAACDDDILAQWSGACYKIGGCRFVITQARDPPPISEAVIGPTFFPS